MRVETGNFYLVRPYATSTNRVVVKAVGEFKGKHEGQRADTGASVFFDDIQVIAQLTRAQVNERVPLNIWA